MRTKTQNLITHFVDEFGAVSRNAFTAVPSEHNIFAFGLGLVLRLRFALALV